MNSAWRRSVSSDSFREVMSRTRIANRGLPLEREGRGRHLDVDHRPVQPDHLLLEGRGRPLPLRLLKSRARVAPVVGVEQLEQRRPEQFLRPVGADELGARQVGERDDPFALHEDSVGRELDEPPVPFLAISKLADRRLELFESVRLRSVMKCLLTLAACGAAPGRAARLLTTLERPEAPGRGSRGIPSRPHTAPGGSARGDSAFSRAFARWVSAVRGLIRSRSAICALERPSAASWSTSRSRPVRSRTDRAGFPRPAGDTDPPNPR